MRQDSPEEMVTEIPRPQKANQLSHCDNHGRTRDKNWCLGGTQDPSNPAQWEIRAQGDPVR